jgi:anaerobic dimethyl sulfoxide reductase subunit B (iron-sulfur subunit)
MQMAFYFDQSRCTGCYACAIACRDKHDIQDTQVSWRRIVETETGAYPGVCLSYVSLSCCHCAQPACAEACPVAAIAKRVQDGIMTVDREACLGGDACGACKEACPYAVPQFSSRGDGKMQMCSFCLDRLSEGRPPACVSACPLYALDAGPMEELKKTYGEVKDIQGFACSAATKPSIIFKPRY